MFKGQLSSQNIMSSLCIVILPILGMLILRFPLSRTIVDTVFICCFCLVFLLHYALFVMPALVLLLPHFQFPLPNLPSAAIRTRLRYQ